MLGALRRVTFLRPSASARFMSGHSIEHAIGTRRTTKILAAACQRPVVARRNFYFGRNSRHPSHYLTSHARAPIYS